MYDINIYTYKIIIKIIRKNNKLHCETGMVMFNIHAITIGPEFSIICQKLYAQNNLKEDVICIEYVFVAQSDVISYINNQTLYASEVRKDSPH